ncbi:MAG: transporter [Candidatus Kapabacteria bacterium]|nr:transporter [Candidatus Kapabacteria bacterium]
MNIRYMLWIAFITAAMLSLSITDALAQGCVAVRGGAMCGGANGGTINLQPGEWSLTTGLRYFQSYKHYRGTEEERYRVEQGTEVINNASFIDLVATYGITDRLFATAIVPFAHFDRSSMYEHGGNPRFDASGALIGTWAGSRNWTSSAGLGDIRLSLGYWLFNPEENNFNYSVALGVKLPTGPYNVTDNFYNQGANRDQTVEGVVDQSIQLGDGGWGATIDVQGVHPLTESITLVTNLSYMANFTNTNGVRVRGAGDTWTLDSAEFSSADQFGLRLGAFYSFGHTWSAYLGGRAEGVPAHDVIGESQGFRRPGHAVSIEPGINYMASKLNVFVSVPIAVYRERTQSHIDMLRSEARGTEVIGDAAFADYLINVGVSVRL